MDSKRTVDFHHAQAPVECPDGFRLCLEPSAGHDFPRGGEPWTQHIALDQASNLQVAVSPKMKGQALGVVEMMERCSSRDSCDSYYIM